MKRTPYLFSAGTPMARRMEAYDWQSTPIGPPIEWDSALKTLVPVMLASNQPMFLVWGPGRTLLYNDAYREVLADKDCLALGSDFLSVWYEIQDALRAGVEAAYRGEASAADQVELWTVRRGYREETHFSFFYSPIRNDEGLVNGFFGACSEKTAQVVSERDLAVREARHRGVLENMGEGFVLLDRHFTVLEINDTALRLINMNREEVIGSNHWARFPGSFESPFGRMYRRVAESGRPERVEHTYVLPDGHEVWLEVRSFAVGEDIAVLFDDITEKKRLREEYAVSLERVQLALDAGAIVGTWVWNILEDRVYGDERFAESFGLDPAGLRSGQPIALAFAAIHADDRARVQEAVADSVSRMVPYRCQYRVLRGRAFRWVEAIGRVELGSDGRPERFPGVLLDIEDRRRIESERDGMVEALRIADQRKDEFLAMLAHELRNPLAPIMTAAQVLHAVAPKPDQVAHLGAMITRQAGHLSRLVDDLLDVSRVTRGLIQLKRERVELGDVVAAAVEQVTPTLQAKGHQLRLETLPAPCYVLGDFHRLVQVVVNLLGNAAKYTPAGGLVEVSMNCAASTSSVAVKDNGIGLPPGMLNEVFSLFVQAERAPDRTQGGLGIGLALVRALVELHGGKVSAESPGLGRGSTFTVELPSIAGDAPEPTLQAERAPHQRSRRVMLVDDNRDAAESLALVLVISGHQVHVAHDAQGALALLELHADWDTFILDIGLPDMTGYELAQEMRRRPGSSGAHFIALTGYGQSADRDQAMASGFDRHLIKPVSTSTLLEIIDEASARK